MEAFEFEDKARCLFETFVPLGATLAYIWWWQCVTCWPILVNLKAFQNNQGWEARRRQRNSNEPFSRKGIETYGIYLPLFGCFIFRHSFPRRREGREGSKTFSSRWWRLKRSACGSSWPAERNFGLAAMMGGG